MTRVRPRPRSWRANAFVPEVEDLRIDLLLIVLCSIGELFCQMQHGWRGARGSQGAEERSTGRMHRCVFLRLGVVNHLGWAADRKVWRWMVQLARTAGRWPRVPVATPSSSCVSASALPPRQS